MTLAAKLQGTIWSLRPFGPRHDIIEEHSLEQLLGRTLDDFGEVRIADSFDLLDGLLDELQIRSKSTGSALESKASKTLSSSVALIGVMEDKEWLDDVVKRFILTVGDGLWKDHPRWDSFCLSISLFCSQQKILQENNESAVDRWATRGGDIAEWVNKLLRPDLRPIRTQSQAAVKLFSDGVVHPDIEVLLGDKLFERIENKTLPVMGAHAVHLNNAVGKKLTDIGTDGTKAMFKQAYAASMTDEQSCNVVWMGHPCLYRVAFVRNRYLYVSGWRSLNPIMMHSTLVDHYGEEWTTEITQGHFLAETLALASISVDDFEEFLSARPLRVLRTTPREYITGLIQISVSAIERQLWSRIYLEDSELYGSLQHWGGRHQLPSLFPKTLKPFKVWSNDDTVVKVVGDKELEALKDVGGIPGIPALQGIMIVKSRPNKGLILAFTPFVGLPSAEDWSISIISDLRQILLRLHEKGWHHHDVYPRNVLQDSQGQVYLVDFGMAQRAEECEHGDDCPDLEVLGAHRADTPTRSES